jgi:hypothetical protein
MTMHRASRFSPNTHLFVALGIMLSVFVAAFHLSHFFIKDNSSLVTKIHDKYHIYEAFDDVPHYVTVEVDKSFTVDHYVFPGSTVTFTGAIAADHFEAEFLPRHLSWERDVEQSVSNGNLSQYSCRFYSKNPFTGAEYYLRTGQCPNITTPSLELRFRVINDPGIIGKMLTIHVKFSYGSDNAATHFSDFTTHFQVSAKENFDTRRDEYLQDMKVARRNLSAFLFVILSILAGVGAGFLYGFMAVPRRK